MKHLPFPFHLIWLIFTRFLPSSLTVGKHRSEQYNRKGHQLLEAVIFSKGDALLVALGSS